MLHLAVTLGAVLATFASDAWQGMGPTRSALLLGGSRRLSGDRSRSGGARRRSLLHHALCLPHLGLVFLLRRASFHHHLVVKRLLRSLLFNTIHCGGGRGVDLRRVRIVFNVGGVRIAAVVATAANGARVAEVGCVHQLRRRVIHRSCVEHLHLGRDVLARQVVAALRLASEASRRTEGTLLFKG